MSHSHPRMCVVLGLVALSTAVCGRSFTLGAVQNDGDPIAATDDVSGGDPVSAADPLPPQPYFPRDCSALAAPRGTVVDVTPAQADNLANMIAASTPGTTFRLASGTYALSASLDITVAGTVVRSATGIPDDVVLSGAAGVLSVIHIAAAQVTLAEIALTGGGGDLTHADAFTGMDLSQLLVYRVHFLNAWDTAFVSGGNLGGVINSPVLACSTFEVTDAFRPTTWTQPQGARIFGTRNFLIYRNVFTGIYHPDYDDSSAINMSLGTRAARVERNVFENSAVPLRLGLVTTDPGNAVSYADNPCADLGAYSDVYEVAVCSNTVFADIAEFDTGISPWAACNSVLAHNTVYGAPLASSIDVRGAGTRIDIVDNAMSQVIVEQPEVTPAELFGNVENLPSTAFVDTATRNLHLASGSPAIAKGLPLTPGLCDLDIDGNPYNPVSPDAGADQLAP